MVDKLQVKNFLSFRQQKIDELEKYHDYLKRIIVDMIANQTIDTLKNELNKLTQDYEKIYNQLNLDDEQNALCYYFGRICSMTDVSLAVLKDQTTTKLLDNVLDSYPLLLPALRIISENGTISGPNLKRELKLKSDSNLSNFIKRIAKYNLINIDKIGTSNYYTLSVHGRRLLNNQNRIKQLNNAELKISFKELISLLNVISDEMSYSNPNVLSIVQLCASLGISVGEKNILKQKLYGIFNSRDNYFRCRLQQKTVYNIAQMDNVIVDSDYSIRTRRDEYIYENVTAY